MENNMGKLVLKYLGDDYLGLPVYRTEDGTMLKDTSCGLGLLNLHTLSGDDPDDEPNIHISRLKKYQGLEIEVVGRVDEPTSEEKFNYQMLSRLQSDCDYYLGFGNRCENHLWSKNVVSQIVKMKELYNGFSKDKKPKWLTFDDILNYEKLMTA